MRKRNYKSVISMVLTAAMVAGLMSPINALAETETTETPYDPFVVSAEKADGVMNLTELGTMDWVHVNGERVERKAGGSGDIVIDTDTDVFVERQSGGIFLVGCGIRHGKTVPFE